MVANGKELTTIEWRQAYRWPDEWARPGEREQLTGKIQEMHGITKEETERHISDWQASQRDKSY